MDNFELKKVKLHNHLGVYTMYHEKLMNNKEEYWAEKTSNNLIHRHQDMDNVADELKIHVARIFGILAIGLYKDEEDFNSREKKLLEETLESINIIGITLSGSEENGGVVISATRKVLNNKTIVMNTPHMKYADESYSYCYDLQETVQKLTEEVWEYMFKRKYAQLEIPFGVDKMEAKDVKKIGDNIKAQIDDHKEEKKADAKVKDDGKKITTTTGSKKGGDKITTTVKKVAVKKAPASAK